MPHYDLSSINKILLQTEKSWMIKKYKSIIATKKQNTMIKKSKRTWRTKKCNKPSVISSIMMSDGETALLYHMPEVYCACSWISQVLYGLSGSVTDPIVVQYSNAGSGVTCSSGPVVKADSSDS